MDDSICAIGHRKRLRRTVDRRSRRLVVSIALVVGIAVAAAATAPASAQLMDGMVSLVAPYTIQVNGRVVGRVVVVGWDNTNPPPGYAAGTEYWTWTSGVPWRGAFTLVPSTSVPSHASYTWQRFPHEHFDLTGTVPFPAVSPGPNDEFYRVQIASGTGWVDRGYMWLDTGSPAAQTERTVQTVQTWYGVGLTTDLVGDGGPVRFRTVEPPTAGSKHVYLLEASASNLATMGLAGTPSLRAGF